MKCSWKTLEQINSGKVSAETQQEVGAIYAHKIESDEMRIDWKNSAEKINAQIKALNPDAYFAYNDTRIKDN